MVPETEKGLMVVGVGATMTPDPFTIPDNLIINGLFAFLSAPPNCEQGENRLPVVYSISNSVRARNQQVLNE